MGKFSDFFRNEDPTTSLVKQSALLSNPDQVRIHYWCWCLLVFAGGRDGSDGGGGGGGVFCGVQLDVPLPDVIFVYILIMLFGVVIPTLLLLV